LSRTGYHNLTKKPFTLLSLRPYYTTTYRLLGFNTNPLSRLRLLAPKALKPRLLVFFKVQVKDTKDSTFVLTLSPPLTFSPALKVGYTFRWFFKLFFINLYLLTVRPFNLRHVGGPVFTTYYLEKLYVTSFSASPSLFFYPDQDTTNLPTNLHYPGPLLFPDYVL
jgi:hypothetical protein